MNVNTTAMEVLVNLDLSLRMNIAFETMLNDRDLTFICKQDSLPRTRGTLTYGIENRTLPNVDGQNAHCPVQNYKQSILKLVLLQISWSVLSDGPNPAGHLGLTLVADLEDVVSFLTF